MNFLGHSYFKGNSPLFLTGNLCGDFYKGLPSSLNLPEEMVEGIKFHRKLDILTDSTLAVSEAKKKLLEYGLFSGIIIDIFYDHFLAVNWRSITGTSIDDHSHYVYSVVKRNSHLIPEKSKGAVTHMIEEDWFKSYQSIDFIEMTLNRISRRISRENNLSLSISSLKDNYNFFQENFFQFWDEINDNIK